MRTAVSVAAYPFLKILRISTDAAAYMKGLVVSYNEAHREAEALRARLSETVLDTAVTRELWAENRRLREMLRFQRDETRFVLMPAKVIGRFEGTLIIDRGESHGVRPLMCAMTAEGVVGVVAKVLPFQSYVYTLHNADCRIGAMIVRNRAVGMVHGSGSDFSHICRMEYIDMKDEVQTGDLVVTSGGPVFPPGLPIGKVTARFGERALLQRAYVEPAADIYRVEELFLVDRYQRSADERAGRPIDPGSRAGGAPMPEWRTLQEQFAP